MNDEKLLRLLHIKEELIEIRHWLNENQNSGSASHFFPITNELTDELTRLILELSATPSASLDH